MQESRERPWFYIIRRRGQSSITWQPPGDPIHAITLPPYYGVSLLIAMPATPFAPVSTTYARLCMLKAPVRCWLAMAIRYTSSSMLTHVTLRTFAASWQREAKAHCLKLSLCIAAHYCKVLLLLTHHNSRNGCASRRWPCASPMPVHFNSWRHGQNSDRHGTKQLPMCSASFSLMRCPRKRSAA